MFTPLRTCGMRLELLLLCLGTGLFLATPECQAQTLRLQQPIVQQFGANTTVLVPDRGQAHIGSVSRGWESRFQTGPWGRGSLTSRAYSESTLSTSVTIQDFAEMDRDLLQRAPQATPLPYEDTLETSLRRLQPAAEVARNPTFRPNITSRSFR